MRPIILIGTNFVRTQWVVLTVMLVYVVGMAGIFGFHETHSEVLFFLKQQACYAIFFGALIMTPVIQAERKSRRVLAVLSKGIHRWQYLGGLLFGSTLIAASFCAVVCMATLWLAQQAGVSPTGVLPLMLVLFLSCLSAAAVALLCSVLMHPFLALAGTLLILLFPFAVELKGWYLPNLLFPVAAFLRVVLNFSFQQSSTEIWRIGVTALLHALVFWMAASAAFARQDVTIASE